MTTYLVAAPANTSSQTYQQLAYVDAYDAVLNCDYAFVAYKETLRKKVIESAEALNIKGYEKFLDQE